MTHTEAGMPVADLLAAIRDHLVGFELPEPYGVQTRPRDPHGDDPQVSIHLAELLLPAVAGALRAWIKTLTDAHLSLWRPPLSDTVHIQVFGRLAGAVPIEVWGVVQDSGLLAGLEPGQKRLVPRRLLRAWMVVATDEHAGASVQTGSAA